MNFFSFFSKPETEPEPEPEIEEFELEPDVEVIGNKEENNEENKEESEIVDIDKFIDDFIDNIVENFYALESLIDFRKMVSPVKECFNSFLINFPRNEENETENDETKV